MEIAATEREDMENIDPVIEIWLKQLQLLEL